MLTDVLVDLGFVDRGEMDEAIDERPRPARRPSACCWATARSPTTTSRARSPSASASTTSTSRVYKVDPDAAKLVTPAAVKRYQAVPVSFASDRTLLVAMADPANVLAVDDIAVMTGYEVRPAVSSAHDIECAARAPRGPRLRHRRRRPRPRGRRRGHRGAAAVRSPDALRADVRRPRARRRSTSAPAARTRRSSSSCTASSTRRSSAAPPTSTSSRRRGHARPLPHRRRAAGGRHRPQTRPCQRSCRA